MKKTVSRILAFFVLVCILSTALSFECFANSDAKRWNIMLVIDGSGSLFSEATTDPDGLRYEAIDAFFAMLQDNGHNVGAIVFSGNNSFSASEADMEKGIRLNTGIISFDQNENAKSYLMSAISNKNTLDRSGEGTTDIGTALLYAERQLSAIDNGLDSAIFLFTDGATDMNSADAYAKSIENLNLATSEIYKNGIRLCGVFLNKDHSSNSTEVRDIVCAANGISASGLNLGNSYIEIYDADSMSASTDKFLKMLGMSIKSEDPDIINCTTDKTFRIPGVGVEEANIRILSVHGETLPKDLDISFIAPDQTVYAGADAAAFCYSGRTFRVYKIKEPMCGTWTVHIEMPEESTLEVYYTPSFSMYVTANLETSPAAADITYNSSPEVRANLLKNGSVLTGADAYREYKCNLYLTNVNTGELTVVELEQDGQGNFVRNIKLDSSVVPYGTYDVYASFECDELQVSSPIETWILENHPPKAWDSTIKVNYGLLQKKSTAYNLQSVSSDTEDAHAALSYSIENTSCDPAGIDIVGSELIVNGKIAGDGTVTFRVTDTQGSYDTAEVTIVAKNMTFLVVLGIVIILFLIATAVILKLRHDAKFRPDGILTLDLEVNKVTLSVELTPPGIKGARKMNLLDMVNAAIRDDDGRINVDCKKAGITDGISALSAHVNSNAAEFKRVELSTVKGKVRGEKQNKAKIKVKYGKKVRAIYNESMTIDSVGDVRYEVFHSDDDDSTFDDDFDFPSKDNSKIDDIFDFD